MKLDAKIQVMQQIQQQVNSLTLMTAKEFETLLDTLIYHILAAARSHNPQDQLQQLSKKSYHLI